MLVLADVVRASVARSTVAGTWLRPCLRLHGRLRTGLIEVGGASQLDLDEVALLLITLDEEQRKVVGVRRKRRDGRGEK